jgi:hypothetical protein
LAFPAFEFVDAEFALVKVFVSTTIAVFEATLVFTVELTLAFASTFEFVSAAGVVSPEFSVVVCKTEILPVKAGIAKNKADSIKTVAAPIVIFDKIVCDPRG